MNFELDRIRAQWGGKTPLWVFAYASLIWRPEFDIEEQTLAKVNGWHRTLQMWSRVNRGTTTHPGLVFTLTRGGSCWGLALRCLKLVLNTLAVCLKRNTNTYSKTPLADALVLLWNTPKKPMNVC